MSDDIANVLKLPSIQYGRPMPTLDSVQTIDWQTEARDRIVTRLTIKGYRGVILRGSTGLGKMYITANAIKELADKGHLVPPPGSINPIPVLWITPKSLKLPTQRCLKEYGIAHLVMVMSYGQLKNQDGIDMFLNYRTEIISGQPTIIPEFYPHMLPALVVCDEIQKVKNAGSMQSFVIMRIPETVKWIGASATPWQRPSDAMVHLVRCGVVTPHNALPCTEGIVSALVRDIAYPKKPDEYSPSAVQRLREAIEDYIVELKNVRFKHPTKTNCESIDFKTELERQTYQKAYDDYLRELWEIKHIRKTHYGVIKKWVAMQKFQQKAEFIRCGEMAERAIIRLQEGKQVIIASNYVETLRQVWRILTQKFAFPEDKLAFIVGKQTELARQKNVDNFQSGKAEIILFTMKSGGVGLSLHHDRASTKPRHIILPPTWSAIDLVQALGRGHRLTSMSPTTQEILWYRGTVEDRVKEVVQRKTKCISKSVTAKEQFITLFEKNTEEDMEIDTEENDQLNEVITEERIKEAGDNGDVDDAGSGEEEVTGEGLDSVDNIPDYYAK